MKLHDSLVGVVLRRVLAGHPSFTANPVGDWSDLVGEQVARYTQPRSLKNRVLTVTAYDSVWKHHLELCKGALVEKINHGRSEPLVEKIVIRVGEMSLTPSVLNPNYRQLEKLTGKKTCSKRKRKACLRQLTPEEQRLLKSLPDVELRRIGARLLRRLPSDEASG